jgi:hypothetical protein
MASLGALGTAGPDKNRELTLLEQAPLNEPPLLREGGGDPVRSRLLAWAELVVAVLLAVTALIFAIFMPALIGSGGIEMARDYLHLTPDFFPRLTMVLLSAVCARYAVGAARGLARSTGRHDDEDLEKLKRAGFMVLVAVFYAATISWLGFILATMLVATVVSYFLGLRKPWSFVPCVIIGPIAIRFVFERWLYIALPRSEIEFVAVAEDAVIGFLVAIQTAVIAFSRFILEAVL